MAMKTWLGAGSSRAMPSSSVGLLLRTPDCCVARAKAVSRAVPRAERGVMPCLRAERKALSSGRAERGVPKPRAERRAERGCRAESSVGGHSSRLLPGGLPLLLLPRPVHCGGGGGGMRLTLIFNLPAVGLMRLV